MSWAEGGGILKTKLCLCLSLRNMLKEIIQNSIHFFRLIHSSTGQTVHSPLHTVHFRTDINTHLLGALHHTQRKMSEKGLYCCLLFHEMSIRENVRFNQKFDYTERFEDLGSQGTTCNITRGVQLLRFPNFFSGMGAVRNVKVVGGDLAVL